jgi:hypothetical protein
MESGADYLAEAGVAGAGAGVSAGDVVPGSPGTGVSGMI